MIVALGGLAWTELHRVLADLGWRVRKPRVPFGHGAESQAARPADQGGGVVTLIASYHPSQQNTFTGTLTEEMFDSVWARARRALG